MCHLFRLDLSVNNLGVPGAQALGTVMSNLTQARTFFNLFLYITTLGDEGVRAFVQSLEGTCHLMYFYLHYRSTALLTTFTCIYEENCVHEQKARGPAMHMHNFIVQWARSMGMAMMANENTLFVTFVGSATEFEA